MKKTILYGITAVAMMFASCTKDLTNDFTTENGIKRGELITVNVEKEATRLSADEEGVLTWNDGDEIAVILVDENGHYGVDRDTYKVKIDPATGKTLVEIPDNTAYAIYPASRVANNWSNEVTKDKEGNITEYLSTITLTLPHTYTVTTPEDIFDYNLMRGQYIQDDMTIYFANLMGYVQVPLTGEGIVKGVTLKSETQNWAPLSNKCTVELNPDFDIYTSDGVTMAMDNNAFSFVKVAFKEGLDLSTNPSVYIPVPAGKTYENLGIVVIKENESNAFYAKNSHEILRGAIKPISKNPIDPASFTPQNPTSLTGTTGKNYKDYASCYLVPPTPGSYSFKTTLSNGTTLSQGVCAEILWSEGKTLVYDLHYDAETNTISFKTDGTEGNAFIAFSCNTFATADIEWFWHIWVTDTPGTVTISTTGNTTKYTFMDRVVGATWAPSQRLTASETQTVGSTTFPINKSVSAQDATDACGLYFQYQNRVAGPRLADINDNRDEALPYAAASKKLAISRVAVCYGFNQYAQYWSGKTTAAGVLTQDAVNGQYYSNNMYYPYYMYSLCGNHTYTNDAGTEVKITTGANSWIHTPLIGTQSVTPTATKIATTFPHGTDKYAYRLWNNKNGNGDASVKTPHDPCPPGYIIDVSNFGYWWVDKNSTIEGIVRNPADDADFTAGYCVYGMYYDATDANGNPTSMYLPCAANRYDMLLNRRKNNNWANMGYLYFHNTDSNLDKETGAFEYYSSSGNKYTGIGFSSVLATGVHKTWYGANIQYGARNNGVLAKVSRNAKKTVNAQAYNVRCAKQANN